MRDVALRVHLRLFALGRRGERHHAKAGGPSRASRRPGCRPTPAVQTRTSPETKTRKAEPADKSLINRRLSAPSPALCSTTAIKHHKLPTLRQWATDSPCLVH